MNSLSPKKQTVSVAKGAVLTVGARWFDRLVGIVSTIILARLLVPADFGIVAMASLVVALIDTLLDLGVNAALVQNRQADHEDFNTAWTLRLIQATLVAILIAVVGAPLAADYFKDPRVVDVLRVMALSMFVSGFENIGIVSFQKNMEYGLDFRFFFLRRLAGFIVTTTLAFLLHSYWAMVIGALSGRTFGVALSYQMHKFRPKLSLSKFSRLWAFSQWILVRNLGSYGIGQTDKLLVGRRSDSSTLGAYSLADEISAIPTNELLMPLGRVLFPIFVKVVDKPEELRRAFCLAVGVQALIALPVGVGLALVAHVAVPLLLGQQWLSAIPLVQRLALINVALALTYSSTFLLLALGKVHLQAILEWVQFLTLLSLTVLVFPGSGAHLIAELRLSVSIAAALLLLILVLRTFPLLTFRDLLGYTWRPLIAACVMAAVLLPLEIASGWPLPVQLAFEVLLGAIAYASTILLLWRLTGWQPGAERYLVDALHIDRWLDKIRRPR